METTPSTSHTPHSPLRCPATPPTLFRSASTPVVSVFSTPDTFIHLQDQLVGLVFSDDVRSPPVGSLRTPVTGFGPSTPPGSSSASYRLSGTPSSGKNTVTEGDDQLSPLPLSASHMLDRPRLGRGQTLPVRPTSHSRLTPPSPPPLGLSELLCGSQNLSSAHGSYFPSSHSKSQMSFRTESSPRREIAYSTFGSSYGDLQSGDAWMCTVPTTRPPSSDSGRVTVDGSPRPLSESGSSPSGRSSGTRSPRVRNGDGILAPHGSFTSARSRTSLSSISRSGGTSDEDLAAAIRTPLRAIIHDEAHANEVTELEKSAASGDQLALYRLGRNNSVSVPRHTLGRAVNIWGSATSSVSLSPLTRNSSMYREPSTTRRSSNSSQCSFTSQSAGTTSTVSKYPSSDPANRSRDSSANSPTLSPAISGGRVRGDSDLFSDVARLAIRSEAYNNLRRTSSDHPAR